jgi:hypothetical protein
MAMVLLNRDLESKLSALPANTRSEYLRQAIDLMVTISPPEKFVLKNEPMAEGENEAPEKSKIIQVSLEERPPPGELNAIGSP